MQLIIILIIIIILLIKISSELNLSNSIISFESNSIIIELYDLYLLSALELFSITIVLYYVPWSIHIK